MDTRPPAKMNSMPDEDAGQLPEMTIVASSPLSKRATRAELTSTGIPMKSTIA